MMLHEHELKRAAELVAHCEHSLRRFLAAREIGDLCADNINEWTVEKCTAVAKSLTSGHGVGAFHMVEARRKEEQTCG